MSAPHRISALAAQLAPSTSTTMAETKPPITCHVLDTTIGRPAASIPVTLTLHGTSTSTGGTTTITTTAQYTALTNGDGRVTAWQPSTMTALALADAFHHPGDQAWSLAFETGRYFSERGVTAFFPEVVVRFQIAAAAKGEHYHVPVLLGPFGYTTYRGS